MKISPEARETALRLCGFDSEDDLIYWGRLSHREKVDGIAAAMQSLINSTLERAAGVAEGAMRKTRSYEVGGQYNQGCFDSAWAIRQLMEGNHE